MTVAQGLVRLYPRAFRDRWGADLAVEVRTSGPRSWPNLLAGVADMWLHPAAWPARSAAQRQARVVAVAVIVTGIGWFAAHLMVEGTRGLPRMLDVCAVAVVAGLLLAVPRPAPATLKAIGRRLLRRLAGPAVLGVAVVAVVHGTGGSFVPPIRLAVLACWWGSWGWAVIQVARTIAGVGSDPAVPRGASGSASGSWPPRPRPPVRPSWSRRSPIRHPSRPRSVCACSRHHCSSGPRPPRPER